MGYMGFGMQKWIYQYKPRRTFQHSKATRSNVVNDADNTFDGHESQWSEEENKRYFEEVFEAKKKSRLAQRVFFAVNVLFVGIIIVLIIMFF